MTWSCSAPTKLIGQALALETQAPHISYGTQATYSQSKHPWSSTPRQSNRPTHCISHRIIQKVELREGGVEAQRLSYRPPSPLPQRIATKVELREGGVEGQPLSYRPPCPLPQRIASSQKRLHGPACVRVVLRPSPSPIARPPPSPNELPRKVELREGGVEGQRLSDRPPSPLPQRIATKVSCVRVVLRPSPSPIARPPPSPNELPQG